LSLFLSTQAGFLVGGIVFVLKTKWLTFGLKSQGKWVVIGAVLF
jgi:hypothetical protein